MARRCVSTFGHPLGRGRLHHLLVLAHQLGQVVGDGHVEPRDGAAAEVGARRRQLLELVQRVQPEEVPIRLRIGKVVPGNCFWYFNFFLIKKAGQLVLKF